MSEYLIYKDDNLLNNGAPTAHAIVIGVGAYSYLNGGSGGRVTSKHGGLGQLSSPPESAKVFTKWLLDEYNNPNAPLATISLLISQNDGLATFSHERIPSQITPKEPTIQNAKTAIREWKSFGDRNDDNLLLFFFCGHGVARGMDGLTLLLADYGESDDYPMEGAIDFAVMLRGMAQCKASRQCYFVDTCRIVSDIATRTTATGQAIIQDDTNRTHNSDWNVAVFYSTIGGEAAYGRKNKPSFYTEELINGLNGFGSHNRSADGKWRVSTADLHTAIHYGLSLRGDKIKPPMTYQSVFEFHELHKDPIARAVVNCDPESDNEFATFYCKQNNQPIKSRPPAVQGWELIIPYGKYDFSAQIDQRSGQERDIFILPPHKDIAIKVAQ